MIDFFVSGKPVPKARARVVRIKGMTRSFTPEATVNYELLVRYHASVEMAGRQPTDKPCALKMIVCVLPPASWSQKRKDAAIEGRYRPTVKPDLSNIQKSIEDALNGIAYRDDSQIVEAAVIKAYSARQGVHVTVNILDAEPTPK